MSVFEVPAGIKVGSVDELVELYGGEMQASRESERQFILPLRRGVAVSGGVECTVTWAVDAADQADEEERDRDERGQHRQLPGPGYAAT